MQQQGCSYFSDTPAHVTDVASPRGPLVRGFLVDTKLLFRRHRAPVSVGLGKSTKASRGGKNPRHLELRPVLYSQSKYLNEPSAVVQSPCLVYRASLAGGATPGVCSVCVSVRHCQTAFKQPLVAFQRVDPFVKTPTHAGVCDTITSRSCPFTRPTSTGEWDKNKMAGGIVAKSHLFIPSIKPQAQTKEQVGGAIAPGRVIPPHLLQSLVAGPTTVASPSALVAAAAPTRCSGEAQSSDLPLPPTAAAPKRAVDQVVGEGEEDSSNGLRNLKNKAAGEVPGPPPGCVDVSEVAIKPDGLKVRAVATFF